MSTHKPPWIVSDNSTDTTGCFGLETGTHLDSQDDICNNPHLIPPFSSSSISTFPSPGIRHLTLWTVCFGDQPDAPPCSLCRAGSCRRGDGFFAFMRVGMRKMAHEQDEEGMSGSERKRLAEAL